MAGRHTMMGAKTVAPMVIDVQASDYATNTTSPTAATASVSFNSNGTVSMSADSGASYSWRTGGASTGLEIMFETAFGTLSSGTADTWLALTSNQSAGVTRTTTGAKAWNGTVRIRRASDGVELDSAAISLTATVEFGG